MRKNKRINIRISEIDIVHIQRKAVENGLPYQTLISSLLHKYAGGNLIEKALSIQQMPLKKIKSIDVCLRAPHRQACSAVGGVFPEDLEEAAEMLAQK